MNLSKLTIESAHKLLTEGEVSAVELTQHYLGQIDSKNKRTKCFSFGSC